MNIKDIDDILSKHLDEYDRALSSINHCSAAYEKHCISLISQIAMCTSIQEANIFFDQLLAIQTKLCGVYFGRGIPIGEKLENLVREFDRLDDSYIRQYWYDKFRSGETWPYSNS